MPTPPGDTTVLQGPFGWGFPLSAGKFRRAKASKFDDAGWNVGVGYDGLDVTLTFYVYPRDSDETVATGMEVCTREIAKNYLQTNVELDVGVWVKPAGRQREGRLRIFDLQLPPDQRRGTSAERPNGWVKSYLYLFVLGGCFAKVRVTPRELLRYNLREAIEYFLAALHWPTGEEPTSDEPSTAAGWFDLARAAHTAGDLRREAECLERAAKMGLVRAGVHLGGLYADGEGVPRDKGRARDWLRWAADRGDVEGQVQLASLLTEMGDLAGASMWFSKAAAAGDPRAQCSLGFTFLEGRGVPRDVRVAIAHFERAAAQGNAPGLYNLGVLHRDGVGVPADPRKAIALFERAAKLGHALGMSQLALMYLKRQGVPDAPDSDAIGARWLLEAATAGEVSAQANLAILYENGVGVRHDTAEAIRWRKAAAQQGDAESQEWLQRRKA